MGGGLLLFSTQISVALSRMGGRSTDGSLQPCRQSTCPSWKTNNKPSYTLTFKCARRLYDEHAKPDALATDANANGF